MTDETIFDQTTTSNEDIQSHYDHLVGEGKKFRDNESLARGKYESDQFIESLKRELQETRKELNTRLNMEELVSNIGKNVSTSVPTSTVLENNPNPNPIVTPTKPAVDHNEVAAIVRNTMTQEQTKLSQERNVAMVASQLRQAWGDNWTDHLRKVGRSLDMTEAQMDTLAKTTPKVLLSSVLKDSVKVENDIFAAPRSSVTTSPTANQSQDKGWAAYEKMRRENPRKYLSAEVQVQLHKDVMSGKVVLPSN